MRDKTTIENYSNNLGGVEQAIDKILKAFNQHNIHATWATVGFLFYDIIKLKNNLPKKLPKYKNKDLNPYSYINKNNNLDEKYHFAQHIIKKIVNNKNQEIATHTFSHYYCLEDGQTREEFYSDIEQAIKTIKDNTGNKTYSLVFPRNQWNEDYLSVLSELDILCYRGNEKSWIYNAVNEENNIILRRAVRLLDSYINISGHNTYSLDELRTDKLFNIPSSRFLRPVSKKLSFLETMRLNRIKKSMTYAAKNGELFHLWWHPHNFGADLEANFQFLSKILEHFKDLKNQYNMQSLNMKEVSFLLGGNNES
jgi:peptidoglycan/xylan/chitin deacetylase (PgdA/CDA1 family)